MANACEREGRVHERQEHGIVGVAQEGRDRGVGGRHACELARHTAGRVEDRVGRAPRVRRRRIERGRLDGRSVCDRRCAADFNAIAHAALRFSDVDARLYEIAGDHQRARRVAGRNRAALANIKLAVDLARAAHRSTGRDVHVASRAVHDERAAAADIGL